MVTVKFVYSNPSDSERILDANLSGIFLELFDEGSYEGDELIKAFYSEADKDVLNSLINYLNEGTSN